MLVHFHTPVEDLVDETINGTKIEKCDIHHGSLRISIPVATPAERERVPMVKQSLTDLHQSIVLKRRESKMKKMKKAASTPLSSIK